ncbi:hypothetical protein AgCh_007299 [Apium graveolens]
MGCCLSTTVATTPTTSPDEDAGIRRLPESAVNPTALALDDEETVKEVLSETQTPISMAPSTSVHKAKIPIQRTPTLRNSKLTSTVDTIEEQEEISVVSEMYSISGSFSANTVNGGEEDGEVNQRVVHRSPAKKRSNNSRVNAGAKYGGVRSLESTNSREINRNLRSHGLSSQGESRPRPAQGRTGIVQRRNVGRRDRDYQTPAAASEVIRHRKTAVSGVAGHPGERSRVRKLEESKKMENHNGAVCRESLDNPRVSLECFIFL